MTSPKKATPVEEAAERLLDVAIFSVRNDDGVQIQQCMICGRESPPPDGSELFHAPNCAAAALDAALRLALREPQKEPTEVIPVAVSATGRCVYCGGEATTAVGSFNHRAHCPTLLRPGYSEYETGTWVRACRGTHFHVTCAVGDLSLPGDPFSTFGEASVALAAHRKEIGAAAEPVVPQAPECEHDWRRPMQPAATNVKVCRKCNATTGQAPKERSVAWMIEKGWSSDATHLWWNGTMDPSWGASIWTDNPRVAVRFARKADAKEVINRMEHFEGLWPAHATEHIWIGEEKVAEAPTPEVPGTLSFDEKPSGEERLNWIPTDPAWAAATRAIRDALDNEGWIIHDGTRPYQLAALALKAAGSLRGKE